MINVGKPFVSGKIVDCVSEVVSAEWLSPGGPMSKRFAGLLDSFYGGGSVTLVNSGTSALEISLRACRIGYGITSDDAQVIVPAYTCPDCAIAVIKAGFRPVFADVDPVRMVITQESLENVITPLTVGVMPIHIYGMTVSPSVYSTARNHGLFIVDDMAEAFGASPGGTDPLDLSDFVCTSFRGEKIFPIGAGGMTITRNSMLHGIASGLVGLASSSRFQRYLSVNQGMSYEFPEVLSAVGVAQMEDVLYAINIRRELALHYETLLNVSTFESFDVPWKFPVLVNSPVDAYHSLRSNGIEISPPFSPLHKLRSVNGDLPSPVVQYKVSCDPTLPNVEELSHHVVALPIHPSLSTDNIGKIVDAITPFLKEV